MKKQTIPEPKIKDKQKSVETSAGQSSKKTPVDPTLNGNKTKNNDGGYIWIVS